MACGTGLVGLLPGYQTIGNAAPVLLVLARLLQGFSAGGEWGGSASFLVERAPPGKRGFYGSFHTGSIFLGQLSGILAASVVTSVLGADIVADWGWRIPFLVGALIGPVGLLIRQQVHETPVFREEVAQSVSAQPAQRRLQIDTLFHAFCLVAVQSVVVYTFFLYFPTYMTTYLGVSPSEALWSTTLANFVVMASCILSGFLSDRIGRKPLLLAHCVFFLLLTVPLMAFVVHARPGLGVIVLIQAVIGFFAGLFLGTMPSALTEFFPTATRLVGVGTAYNVASTIFGGFAPFVATWMIAATGTAVSVAGYVVFAAALSTIAVVKFRETANKPLT